VVSDFDPLGDEAKLDEIYKELRSNTLFLTYFEDFRKSEKGDGSIDFIVELENRFTEFITKKKDDAKQLRSKINKYFKILNLIAFVIELDAKYSEEDFLQFWRRFNNEYNNLNKNDEIIDDVEVFFDKRIGIVAPPEPKDKTKKSVPGGTNGSDGKQYKFDILKVIEKRNKEEQEIEELIKDFETKIERFFKYIETDDGGVRVIAKMQDKGTAFDSEEIYDDFAKVYRKFIRRNKATLGEFFIRETQASLNQLCDDFESSLNKTYTLPDNLDIAAKP